MFDVTVESPMGPPYYNNRDNIVFHEVTSFATHVINCASHLRILDLNDIQMIIKITASLKSISFSERFLKICEEYHYSLCIYGLKNYIGSAVSLYDVIYVDKHAFDVNVITFGVQIFGVRKAK